MLFLSSSSASSSSSSPRPRAILKLAVLLLAAAALSTNAQAQSSPASPCAATAKDCAVLALDAMGGRARLEAVNSIGFESVGHTYLVEQSYRQEPFLSAYDRTRGKIDFARQRILLETHSTWPESDPGQAESDSILVLAPDGGVVRGKSGDSPCGLSPVESARFTLALGPMRLLLTALDASDLRFAPAETLRSTSHPVLAFSWRGIPVRILINPFNHLPDAIETVQVFSDHWFQFGDVTQRIYLDNFQLFHGIVYPTSEVEERNGVLWQSTQIIQLDLNIATTDADFKMDPAVAAQTVASKGWDRPFVARSAITLAPGVTLYPGAWNATLVQQDDGTVLLESPLSSTYISGVLDEAKRRYPDSPVKAVLSTSDSWPHVGGIRQVVAAGLPVYILDLNQPLLDRVIAAPHTLHPDALAQSPKSPHWKIVAGKTVIGSGDNRMELYPLRGPSTERQYMVYFPAHKLLYASDTLVLNEDGSLYDPELTREVAAAVARENLDVTTVFAMHQTPIPWSQVQSTLAKSMQ